MFKISNNIFNSFFGLFGSSFEFIKASISLIGVILILLGLLVFGLSTLKVVKVKMNYLWMFIAGMFLCYFFGFYTGIEYFHLLHY